MSTFAVLDAFIALRRKLALLKAAETKDCDMSPNQIVILYKLSLVGKATMGELAEHTLSDKASITRTVALMENAGLIKRKADENDRRIVNIELTAKGKKQAEKAQEIRGTIGKKLENALNAAEKKQFAALVQKIVEN